MAIRTRCRLWSWLTECSSIWHLTHLLLSFTAFWTHWHFSMSWRHHTPFHTGASTPVCLVPGVPALFHSCPVSSHDRLLSSFGALLLQEVSCDLHNYSSPPPPSLAVSLVFVNFFSSSKALITCPKSCCLWCVLGSSTIVGGPEWFWDFWLVELDG